MLPIREPVTQVDQRSNDGAENAGEESPYRKSRSGQTGLKRSVLNAKAADFIPSFVSKGISEADVYGINVLPSPPLESFNYGADDVLGKPYPANAGMSKKLGYANSRRSADFSPRHDPMSEGLLGSVSKATKQKGGPAQRRHSTNDEISSKPSSRSHSGNPRSPRPKRGSVGGREMIGREENKLCGKVCILPNPKNGYNGTISDVGNLEFLSEMDPDEFDTAVFISSETSLPEWNEVDEVPQNLDIMLKFSGSDGDLSGKRRSIISLSEGRSVLKYWSVPCVHFSHPSSCSEGEKCKYAHTQVEIDYHPANFRTKLCSGSREETTSPCHNAWCHRAHGGKMLRTHTARRYLPANRSAAATHKTSKKKVSRRQSLPDDAALPPKRHAKQAILDDGSLDLAFFKVYPCKNKSHVHDRKICPYYHNLRDKRRFPITYEAEQCEQHFDLELLTLKCSRGEECDKCHNRHELLYHAEIYKQRFCSQYHGLHWPAGSGNNLECSRGIYCAFAHSRKEIRCRLFDEEKEKLPQTEFYMLLFKTIWCPYGVQHDWHRCVYAHTYQDCRRSPDIGYGSEPCPFWNKDMHSSDYEKRCPNGSRCPYSHGSKEQLYHPAYYKTMPCMDFRTRQFCPRGLRCAFFHDVNEKRPGLAIASSKDSKSGDPAKGSAKLGLYEYGGKLGTADIKKLQEGFLRPPLFNLDDFEAFGHQSRASSRRNSANVENGKNSENDGPPRPMGKKEKRSNDNRKGGDHLYFDDQNQDAYFGDDHNTSTNHRNSVSSKASSVSTNYEEESFECEDRNELLFSLGEKDSQITNGPRNSGEFEETSPTAYGASARPPPGFARKRLNSNNSSSNMNEAYPSQNNNINSSHMNNHKINSSHIESWYNVETDARKMKGGLIIDEGNTLMSNSDRAKDNSPPTEHRTLLNTYWSGGTPNTTDLSRLFEEKNPFYSHKSESDQYAPFEFEASLSSARKMDPLGPVSKAGPSLSQEDMGQTGMDVLRLLDMPTPTPSQRVPCFGGADYGGNVNGTNSDNEEERGNSDLLSEAAEFKYTSVADSFLEDTAAMCERMRATDSAYLLQRGGTAVLNKLEEEIRTEASLPAKEELTTPYNTFCLRTPTMSGAYKMVQSLLNGADFLHCILFLDPKMLADAAAEKAGNEDLVNSQSCDKAPLSGDEDYRRESGEDTKICKNASQNEPPTIEDSTSNLQSLNNVKNDTCSESGETKKDDIQNRASSPKAHFSHEPKSKNPTRSASRSLLEGMFSSAENEKGEQTVMILGADREAVSRFWWSVAEGRKCIWVTWLSALDLVQTSAAQNIGSASNMIYIIQLHCSSASLRSAVDQNKTDNSTNKFAYSTVVRKAMQQHMRAIHICAAPSETEVLSVLRGAVILEYKNLPRLQQALKVPLNTHESEKCNTSLNNCSPCGGKLTDELDSALGLSVSGVGFVVRSVQVEALSRLASLGMSPNFIKDESRMKPDSMGNTSTFRGEVDRTPHVSLEQLQQMKHSLSLIASIPEAKKILKPFNSGEGETKDGLVTLDNFVQLIFEGMNHNIASDWEKDSFSKKEVSLLLSAGSFSRNQLSIEKAPVLDANDTIAISDTLERSPKIASAPIGGNLTSFQLLWQSEGRGLGDKARRLMLWTCSGRIVGNLTCVVCGRGIESYPCRFSVAETGMPTCSHQYHITCVKRCLLLCGAGCYCEHWWSENRLDSANVHTVEIPISMHSCPAPIHSCVGSVQPCTTDSLKAGDASTNFDHSSQNRQLEWKSASNKMLRLSLMSKVIYKILKSLLIASRIIRLLRDQKSMNQISDINAKAPLGERTDEALADAKRISATLLPKGIPHSAKYLQPSCISLDGGEKIARSVEQKDVIQPSRTLLSGSMEPSTPVRIWRTEGETPGIEVAEKISTLSNLLQGEGEVEVDMWQCLIKQTQNEEPPRESFSIADILVYLVTGGYRPSAKSVDCCPVRHTQYILAPETAYSTPHKSKTCRLCEMAQGPYVSVADLIGWLQNDMATENTRNIVPKIEKRNNCSQKNHSPLSKQNSQQTDTHCEPSLATSPASVVSRGAVGPQDRSSKEAFLVEGFSDGELLNHPLFWSSGDKMEFLLKLYRYIKSPLFELWNQRPLYCNNVNNYTCKGADYNEQISPINGIPVEASKLLHEYRVKNEGHNYENIPANYPLTECLEKTSASQTPPAIIDKENILSSATPGRKLEFPNSLSEVPSHMDELKKSTKRFYESGVPFSDGPSPYKECHQYWQSDYQPPLLKLSLPLAEFNTCLPTVPLAYSCLPSSWKEKVHPLLMSLVGDIYLRKHGHFPRKAFFEGDSEGRYGSIMNSLDRADRGEIEKLKEETQKKCGYCTANSMFPNTLFGLLHFVVVLRKHWERICFSANDAEQTDLMDYLAHLNNSSVPFVPNNIEMAHKCFSKNPASDDTEQHFCNNMFKRLGSPEFNQRLSRLLLFRDDAVYIVLRSISEQMFSLLHTLAKLDAGAQQYINSAPKSDSVCIGNLLTSKLGD